jgi:hypothetical protein
VLIVVKMSGKMPNVEELQPRQQLKDPFNKIPTNENNDSISAKENSVKVDGLN